MEVLVLAAQPDAPHLLGQTRLRRADPHPCGQRHQFGTEFLLGAHEMPPGESVLAKILGVVGRGGVRPVDLEILELPDGNTRIDGGRGQDDRAVGVEADAGQGDGLAVELVFNEKLDRDARPDTLGEKIGQVGGAEGREGDERNRGSTEEPACRRYLRPGPAEIACKHAPIGYLPKEVTEYSAHGFKTYRETRRSRMTSTRSESGFAANCS